MASHGTPGSIDIIVPTLALRQRAGLIDRALDSVLAQQGVTVRVLVVVNGTAADPEVVARLSRDSRLALRQSAEPGIPAALRLGRREVRAPYFGTLDDDDLLLPGALERRVGLLEADSEADAVVSNGFRREEGRDALHVPDMGWVARDPVGAMLRANWLLPGSWLARSGRVGPAVFDGMPRFGECTFLGLRLAVEYALRFDDQPGVVWQADSPAAAHQSEEYTRNQPMVIEALRSLNLSPAAAVQLELKRRHAYHEMAVLEWRRGRLRAAWRWHLRSLVARGGWRHLAFSRRLLRPRSD